MARAGMLVALLAVGLTYGDPAAAALKTAARHGNMPALVSLVQSMGPNVIDLEPAFVEASTYGRVRAMEYLIEKGASDVRGALIKAASRNQIGAVRYLMERNESIDTLDVHLARLVAGGADAAETEFYLVTWLQHS